MAIILAVPILTMLVILQTAVVSRIPLLHGTPDLVLVAVIAWAMQKRVQTAWHWGIMGGLILSFVSGLPMGVPLVSCLAAVGISLLLRQRVWQYPILAVWIATFIGTLVSHGLALAALRLSGNSISVITAFNLITLPSLLLNLVIALPFYQLLGDLANWLYPEEIEV